MLSMGLYEEALEVGIIEPPRDELQATCEDAVADILTNGFAVLADGVLVDYRG